MGEQAYAVPVPGTLFFLDFSKGGDDVGRSELADRFSDSDIVGGAGRYVLFLPGHEEDVAPEVESYLLGLRGRGRYRIEAGLAEIVGSPDDAFFDAYKHRCFLRFDDRTPTLRAILEERHKQVEEQSRRMLVRQAV